MGTGDSTERRRPQLLQELHALRARVRELELRLGAEEPLVSDPDSHRAWLQGQLVRFERMLRRSEDLEDGLARALEAVLDLMGCDRAFLLHPCEPDAPSWTLALEHCRVGHEGLGAPSVIQRTDAGAAVLSRVRRSSAAVAVDAEESSAVLGAGEAVALRIRSQLLVRIDLEFEPAWALGIHQCTYDRRWSEQDRWLFEELGQILGKSLETLLLTRRLRDGELTLQSILNAVPVGIGLARERRMVWGNRAMERLGGWTPGGYANQSVRKLYASAEEFERVGRLYGELAHKPVAQTDARLVRADGSFMDATLFARLVDPADPERGVIVVIVDISERREAEARLRQLRDLLHATIDSLPSVLVAVDASCRVTHINRAGQEAAGRSAQEAAQRPLLEVLPWLRRWEDELIAAVTTGRSFEALGVRRSVDGVERYEDLTVHPLRARAHSGAVVRIDDVSERARMAEVMIQSEKMLSVGGLAAGMAHEINNPLAGILQNLQVIQSRILAQLPRNVSVAESLGLSLDTLAEYLRRRRVPEMMTMVLDSGERVARIVGNMLGFARRTSGQLQPTDLRELLDAALELCSNDYDLKTNYDFRAIRILREYDSAVPLVSCDGNRLMQVFFNLLKNGAEALHDNGRWLSDGPPQLTLRLRPEGSTVRVEIEDNGPGLPEEACRRAFEPFFTTKAVGVGTGLGLSVSYFIVTETHGGTLAVEAAPSGGARFVLRLPVDGPEA